ncbi:MAG: prepilin peptidase [Nanoarchaeota archaeon]
MDYLIGLIIIGFLWVITATIFDIKTKEVPNWLNFTLIIVTITYRLLYSITTNNYGIVISGIIGLITFTIIANLLYYAKAFGGGDAKLLIALGGVLWLSTDWKTSLAYATIFIMSLLIIGFIYGITMSIIILARSKKETKKSFMKFLKKQTKNNKNLLIITALLVIIAAITSIYYKSIAGLTITIILALLPILLIYSKTVEKTLLTKKILTKELRPGDWLEKDIKIGRSQIIKAKFDGVTKEEIKIIKKNLEYVSIKDGIPFVPAFLITYTTTIILWYSGRSFITNTLSLI